MKYQNILFFLLAVLMFTSCNLEKEIELNLPEYEPRTVLECYLEPGQPFTVLLTKSESYFDPFPTELGEYVESILEEDAKVFISWGEERIELENQLFVNPLTEKFANYIYPNDLVPEDYNSEFTLEVELADGETITGTTKILRPSPIDSLIIEFSEIDDTLARVFTYVTEDVNEANFYRQTLLIGEDREVEQDFALNDELIESELLFFGTGYDYSPGDTIIARSTHISSDYYRYLVSAGFAIDANGNPFGQPSSIISNISGSKDPIGIFTGFDSREMEVIVEE